VFKAGNGKRSQELLWRRAEEASPFLILSFNGDVRNQKLLEISPPLSLPTNTSNKRW
jgi:hypothetical protein